jgi:hypothetical protein
VQQHPQNATAWRDLATAYEQKHRTADAITALERFTALRPKNQDALTELAAQYTTQASTFSTEAQSPRPPRRRPTRLRPSRPRRRPRSARSSAARPA